MIFVLAYNATPDINHIQLDSKREGHYFTSSQGKIVQDSSSYEGTLLTFLRSLYTITK